MITHAIIQPSLLLGNYVRYFWTLTCTDDRQPTHVLHLMADRFPGSLSSTMATSVPSGMSQVRVTGRTQW